MGGLRPRPTLYRGPVRDPKRDLSERARVLDLLGKAGADVTYLKALLDAELEQVIQALERNAPDARRLTALARRGILMPLQETQGWN